MTRSLPAADPGGAPASTGPAPGRLAAPLGLAVVLADLALVVAAVLHRRPVVEQAVLSAGLDVDPARLGLAVSSALAVLALGTGLLYLLVRGLAGAVDRLRERRTGVPGRLATRVVDVTTAGLQVAVLLAPQDSALRTGAALPLAALLALPVLVWLLHRPDRRDPRGALTGLWLAVGATLATGVAFGRWF